MNISNIVEKCILEHQGGEKFFDALDERIRNDKILLRAIMSRVIFSGINFDTIIVSGHFGEVFSSFIKEEYPFYECFVINGSLRKNGQIHTKFDNSLENKKFIFIDDSFYSGGTMLKVKQYLEENNSKLIATFVFYDGGKEEREDVFSFYRYYKK